MQSLELNEADLLARMRNFEDHLVERKTISDQRDWKKTAVAFANSTPLGLPAILFIGVKNSGEIETPQQDLDGAQKKFNKSMQDVYPRVAYVPKIITENGRQALAVIIPGSESRPHFAGLSYVRRGSETFEASEQEFVSLIAQRSSKAARILLWKGRRVTVVDIPGSQWVEKTVVVDCDQFYATLQTNADWPRSIPLRRIEISFDHSTNALRLDIRP